MKQICHWMLFCLSGWALASGQDLSMQSTVITSERLEMQGTETRNYFYFRGDVQVKGTNLNLDCDELTVVALREGPDTAAIGQIGAIEEIVAQGSVEIHQAGRSAYAVRAEVDPRAGTVTLLQNPRIVDGEVEVEGYQFVLHRGEKKFESIPDPNAPKDMPSRSVVRLGAMPDLGFDQPAESISLDERLEEPPVPSTETETPEPSGVPSGEMPEGEGGVGGNP
jgi:lipopolysaccharide export system protein LptA